jgi:glycosyltransferase involved in cell wall biosynthesis
MPEAPERPPIATAPLGVVLPAYNVEADLERILEGWQTFLNSLDRAYEICIVNDGSTDRTGEAAEALAVRFPQVRVLHHVKKSGIGAALRTGLAVSRLPLFCYAECSMAYQPADLQKMLELIDQVDLVCGYRDPRPGRWLWKDWLYALMVRLVFGVRLKDVDCAFKLFRREVFSRIPIQSDGSFAQAEIVAKANFLGCLIAEVPVTFRPQFSSARAKSDQKPWREAYNLFRNPDFGPPDLPEADTVPGRTSASSSSKEDHRDRA